MILSGGTWRGVAVGASGAAGRGLVLAVAQQQVLAAVPAVQPGLQATVGKPYVDQYAFGGLVSGNDLGFVVNGRHAYESGSGYG